MCIALEDKLKIIWEVFFSSSAEAFINNYVIKYSFLCMYVCKNNSIFGKYMAFCLFNDYHLQLASIFQPILLPSTQQTKKCWLIAALTLYYSGRSVLINEADSAVGKASLSFD